METTALTPCRIANSDLVFTIPIYQRLFAWTDEQITPLLQDLLYNCINYPQTDYHIGLLTTTHKNHLVDGQQRFTVMTLIAIVMRKVNNCGFWNDFLHFNGHLRLTFKARKDDEEFLKSIINSDDFIQFLQNSKDQDTHKYYNDSIASGIITIYEFLCNLTRVVVDDLKLDESLTPTEEVFARYIFQHLAFFTQNLPEEYTPRMMNKYFESMNSSGRNLENHEILKVELLKVACNGDIDGDIYSKLVSMWNIACMMDRTVFGVSDDKRDYYGTVISSQKYSYDKTDNTETKKTIAEVISSAISAQPLNLLKQDSGIRETKFRSFLTFPDFLLQVLYIELQGKNLSDDMKIVTQRFFKRDDLVKTFKKYQGYYDAKEFIEAVYKYRIILDWAVIRIDGEGDYDLLSSNSEYSKLEQYEAMLFASTSLYTYYRWIPFILTTVAKEGFNESNLLLQLKLEDNNWHVCPENNTFDYRKGIDTYYFKRLDYYLWEYVMQNSSVHNLLNEGCCLLSGIDDSIRAYRFHQYNSIEHLYPQNDSLQMDVAKWITDDRFNAEDVKNQLGNLALISDSFNSTQKHQSLNHKFVNVAEHVVDKRLESIKLAIMYCCAKGNVMNWTMEHADEHGRKMMQFLQESYNQGK